MINGIEISWNTTFAFHVHFFLLSVAMPITNPAIVMIRAKYGKNAKTSRMSIVPIYPPQVPLNAI